MVYVSGKEEIPGIHYGYMVISAQVSTKCYLVINEVIRPFSYSRREHAWKNTVEQSHEWLFTT
jgi:hypothetical protein